MLLLADRTMGEYGIEEGGVIHAVINDARECDCIPKTEASFDFANGSFVYLRVCSTSASSRGSGRDRTEGTLEPH